MTEEKPSVDCSFITDFEDHIFVTVDADAFFFLHDLISSYVREKERVVRSIHFVLNHTLPICNIQNLIVSFRFLLQSLAINVPKVLNFKKRL